MSDRRKALYEALEASIEECGGRLDRAKVLETARHFDADNQPTAYQGHPVRFVCCPHPADGARACAVVAEDIVSSVSDVSIHVNTEQSMHVTVFHTSHPNDRRPFSGAAREQELSNVSALAAAIPAFTLTFHSVVATSSGAIIMLFDDPSGSVDRLRHEASATFPDLPAHQTTTIVHTTLARVLTPSISIDALNALRSKCRDATSRLRREGFQVSLTHLWHVEETHYFSAGSGSRTSIRLPPSPPPVHGAPEHGDAAARQRCE